MTQIVGVSTISAVFCLFLFCFVGLVLLFCFLFLFLISPSEIKSVSCVTYGSCVLPVVVDSLVELIRGRGENAVNSISFRMLLIMQSSHYQCDLCVTSTV